MSMITDDERRAWQRRAVNHLGKLLEVKGMPLLVWTVGTGAQLRGEVRRPGTRAERAGATADFETWRRWIGAETTSDHISMGTRRVVALAKNHDGLVDVVLTVDLPTDEELAELEEANR